MENIWIYLVAVVASGGAAVYLLRQYLNRLTKKRKISLRRKQAVAPVRTDSPVDNPMRDFKQEGLNRIQSRFSIIRNALTVGILLIIMLLVVIPFSGYLPAAIVSVFAASVAVIIGILARPFIENFISGIIISLSAPFNVGDTVLIDGHYGYIEDIKITNTVIKLWDWRRLVLPNSKMLNTDFINYTINDKFIWAKVEFWVSYRASLEEVRTLAIRQAKTSRHFANYEDPSFWVMQMDKDGYKCWLAAWTNSPAGAWELGNDVRTGLIMLFQQRGIHAHSFTVEQVSGIAAEKDELRQTAASQTVEQ